MFDLWGLVTKVIMNIVFKSEDKQIPDTSQMKLRFSVQSDGSH